MRIAGVVPTWPFLAMAAVESLGVIPTSLATMVSAAANDEEVEKTALETPVRNSKRTNASEILTMMAAAL